MWIANLAGDKAGCIVKAPAELLGIQPEGDFVFLSQDCFDTQTVASLPVAFPADCWICLRNVGWKQSPFNPVHF